MDTNLPESRSTFLGHRDVAALEARRGSRHLCGCPTMRNGRFAPFALLAVIVLTVVAYLPALGGGFVWDDDAHVTAPSLRSWEGLGRIWFELGATQQYYPLLHSAFWAQAHLWGDEPLGYHVVTLVCHLVGAGLFFVVLRRLEIAGAWFAAALFAVHPVQVESVAWISELKNTLSTALFLGALLAYLRFDAERRAADYGLASFLFVLALATKTVTATLPAVLLVIFWWRRSRLEARRDVVPLLPWFAVGVSAGLLTAWVERTLIGAEGVDFQLSWLERLQLSGKAVSFYASKLLVPLDLSFVYPRWELDAADPLRWLPLLAVAGVFVLAHRIRSRFRGPLAALLLFVGTLFPALGFVNVYPFRYSFVADHFQYLPSLAIFALAGAGSWLVTRQTPPRVRCALAGAVLLGLAALAHRQSGDYRDATTLYRATLARNPGAWMAHNNLGKELLVSPASRAEAIRHFEAALALKPDYAEALNNLGLALSQTGRPREALPYLEESIRLKPLVHQAHNNLGIALAGAGRVEESLAAFAEAARLAPRVPNIRENHGKALLLLGREAEAAEQFKAAAALRAQR